MAASSSNNSIQPVRGMTVAALTHNIATNFLGENRWPGTTKFCLKIMWTAVPVSLNELRRSFQLCSNHAVLSDKCSYAASRTMRKATVNPSLPGE